MPTGKRPTEEIADYMGKVTLVPNSSYLFSTGTIFLILILVMLHVMVILDIKKIMSLWNIILG